NRTPVTLNIAASPILEAVDDVVACGPFTLPAILGTSLSGNEAYYTEVGGSGTRYEPGDVISDLGSQTLYIYDQLAAVANCAGDLSVLTNTTFSVGDLLGDDTHPRYPGTVNPAFWEGNADQQILYDPAAPVGSDSQTYSSIVGDVSLGDTDDCVGTDVRIDVQVTISNQGPDNAFGYPGRFAIINKATNEIIAVDGLVVNFPSGSSHVASV